MAPASLPAPAVARAVRAADCPPAAQVSGDRELARTIRAGLRARDVIDRPPEGCPAVRAEIARRGDILVVVVTDGYGRVSEREVRDVETAITLIDSWTRQEIAEARLEDEPAAADPTVPPAFPGSASAAATAGAGAGAAAPTAIERTARPAPAGGLGVAAESSFALDGTTWAGGSASGCARIGRVCAGGQLRIAGDTGWTDAIDHPRLAVDLLATIELPIRAGGFLLVPGIGVGVGWLRVSGTGPHADQTDESGGVRGAVRFAAFHALGPSLSIGLETAFDGTLLGGEGFLADGGASLSPGGYVRVGLGLRWGWR